MTGTHVEMTTSLPSVISTTLMEHWTSPEVAGHMGVHGITTPTIIGTLILRMQHTMD